MHVLLFYNRLEAVIYFNLRVVNDCMNQCVLSGELEKVQYNAPSINMDYRQVPLMDDKGDETEAMAMAQQVV